MSITSIVQIADRLLRRDFGQDQQNLGRSKQAQGNVQAQSNRTELGDRFTPSGHSAAENAAGEAGLLQVEQLRFTAVNVQATGGNATPTTPAATGGAPAATADTAVSTAGTAPAAAASTATTTAAGATNTAAPSSTTTPQAATAAKAPTTAQSQQDLQSLNSALAALGLNATEIAAFDQFASVVLQFDPNALQDLQNQLNLLASQFQTQNAPAANASPQSIANASPQSAATTPGFQLKELSISFTGVQGTLNQTAQNGGTPTAVSFSAVNLQIKEVRVTLTNPAGQTAQVQAPEPAKPTPATAAAVQAATASSGK